MSRKIKVKDCAGCPYYRYNRGTPDWCENAQSYIREIRFCAWNEWNRMAREEEKEAEA